GGTLFVFLAARQLTGSAIVALTSAVLALLLLPRGYDYDKVLFYPLGMFMCWRYVAMPSVVRLCALAATVVIAGLYRYDTVAYIGGAALVAIAIVHAGDWRTLIARASVLVLACLCLSIPALLFVQFRGGIANAVDQVLTYGQRETARTRLLVSPVFEFGDVVRIVDAKPPENRVLVRWAVSVDEAGRRQAESRHQLVEGAQYGEPENRTWSYRLVDASAASVRALLTNPDVEDTSGINRSQSSLTPEPLWNRAERALLLLRVRLLPGAWTKSNADAFLYHLFRLLPLAAIIVLLIDAYSSLPSNRLELASVSSLIAMCVALNIFIMRDPVGARIGGMAGPVAILAAWMAHRCWRAGVVGLRLALKSTVAVALAVTVWSISASADWERRLPREVPSRQGLTALVGTLAATPPRPDVLPNGEVIGLLEYVRACTSPRDRLLLGWFAPEIYFFAQRAFAAGIAATFGEHWSEPRFEARSLQLLASQSVPIIITLTGDRAFPGKYPGFERYLAEHYENLGRTDFTSTPNEKGPWTLFVRRSPPPSRTHAVTSLPCF
ncbi:MAG TPA: hypothetical protein VFS23_42405, partial [Vicinamibacterales bacterium]|nr:hypothetical protein [Vicinamibacterales bacterium]